jgi:DNA-binding transcriptional MerR regulator
MTTSDLDPTSFPACSLGAEGMAARAADLRALLAPNLRGIRQEGARAEIDLALDAAEERELARLLELERECCSFWRFSLTRRSARLVRLDVAAEAPHEPALDAFLTLTGHREDRVDVAPEPGFRASEAARRAGVGVETLRYYERRGLIAEPRRRPSGQREYTLDDIRTVRAIKTAQHLGFTLAETVGIVRVTRRRDGHETVGLREQVEAKLSQVEDKIRGLELLRTELRAVLAAECDSLVDCDCGDGCPIDPGPAAPRLRVLR